MSHRKIKNSMTNRLHERCLRIMYNDQYSTFEESLEKNTYVTIHKRNLHFIPIEMFRNTKGISPRIVNELFNRNEGNTII